MFTTSPAISSPTNASPNTFHYGPVLSPLLSPLHAPLPRRQSKPSQLQSQSSGGGSMTLSPHLRTNRYVGVDAGTQYSPKEPATNATTEPVDIPDKPPARPCPKPMEPSTQTQEPSSSGTSSSLAAASSNISPSAKRRTSSPGTATTESSAQQDTPASPSKRPRPTPGESKILPQRYELCHVEDMVVLISHMLAELIETNDSLALRGSGSLTRFHSRTAPGISVLDYLNRLARHATLTPPLLLSMVYYIDRLCALYPEFTINTLTVHRFLITAATVAAKGLSDSFWNNTTYARVGGVRVAELKLLELEFLYRVDWKIVPNPEVLVAYYRGLIERCPGYALEGEEDDEISDDSELSDNSPMLENAAV